MERKTALVYDDDYLRHDTGSHPENAERLRCVMERLSEDPIFNELILVKPRKAPIECVEYVHPIEYIRTIDQTCRKGARYLDMDTVISPHSYWVALLAAGGVITAVDAIMNGRADNAMALVRPPGHHAEPERAMGFCLFNNVAIGARYAQKRYDLDRVAIIDWDVHHGNGTQRIFYSDPSVLYISLHQYPHYPGTGSRGEEGVGEGCGFTLNFPLSAGSGDNEYMAIFQEHILPKLETFRPNILFISAGFDGHKDDPLAGMNLTNEGYAIMTDTLVRFSENHCEKRIVSVLEGGYNLGTLPGTVLFHIRKLSGFQ
ncbi:MAG: histone deacetylase [Gemmatimonadota bacterium]|nr:MAG: histone deacetylase [Gemmatimonadota bacterium]